MSLFYFSVPCTIPRLFTKVHKATVFVSIWLRPHRDPPDPRIFSQMTALASDFCQCAGVRLCTGTIPANWPTRQCVSRNRCCCLLFVPTTKRPRRLNTRQWSPSACLNLSLQPTMALPQPNSYATSFTPDADVPVNHYYSPDPPTPGSGYISHFIFIFDPRFTHIIAFD